MFLLLSRDKLNHSLGYFILMILADFSFAPKNRLVSKFLFLFSYGVLLEYVQIKIPGRSFSLYDILANAIGLCSYIILIPLFQKTGIYKKLRK